MVQWKNNYISENVNEVHFYTRICLVLKNCAQQCIVSCN